MSRSSIGSTSPTCDLIKNDCKKGNKIVESFHSIGWEIWDADSIREKLFYMKEHNK